MIPIIVADGKSEIEFLSRFKNRNINLKGKVEQSVLSIIEDVKSNGDSAVLKYTEQFDGFIPEQIEISKEEIESAFKNCDPKFISAITKAADNIKEFHKKQLEKSWLDTKANGVIMGQRIRGLSRVGLYVPGGTAAYPSSVLMNAIPAKLAGVKELIMLTPPIKDKKTASKLLATAKIAGVDKIFTVGGAQAIAALAFGTNTIPKVDKIVGPGNIFVATAKKLLYGVVDIDMVAGPSEILILADETAKPKFLAADLLAQAEHDTLASSILITTSEKIAKKTASKIENQMENLSRSDIIEQSLENFGAIIICESIDKAVELANEISPEHLEVCIKNPIEYIGKLDNAGSVFLGNYSPEALGDYYAGPNHVLPTSGTARFFSPLSVDSFVKKSSFIYYTEPALNEACEDIVTIAKAEGLTAHANSVSIRFNK